MLQELRIRGFKGFRDFQLTDISRVTLVGGKNNVGKTSLLESIRLFYAIEDPGMLFHHLRWRGIDISRTDIESLLTPLFTDFNMDNSITLEVKDGIYTGKMTISFNPSLVEKAISVDISNAGNTTISSKTDVTTATSYHMNIHYEVSDGSQEDVAIVLRQTPKNINIQFEPHPATIIPAEMQHNGDFFHLYRTKDYSQDAARLSQLDIKRKIDRVVDFLQVIEPQLRGLTSVTLPPKPTIYADIQGMDRKVPIGLLDDGISKLLTIILSITATNNELI